MPQTNSSHTCTPGSNAAQSSLLLLTPIDSTILRQSTRVLVLLLNAGRQAKAGRLLGKISILLKLIVVLKNFKKAVLFLPSFFHFGRKRF